MPEKRAGYLSLAVIALYLVAWSFIMPDAYGWIMDDRLVFLKGALTVKDWRGAYAYHSILQPSFFVVTYLPLVTGLSLPSIPIPVFGDETGQFRFLLACTVVYHGLLLALWAWFARWLSSSAWLAFLSVCLFVTSPSLALWTPLPDSRYLGWPFIILGIWCCIELRDWKPPVSLGFLSSPLFWGGTLFGIAQGVHYTSLYLIMPFCLVYWTDEVRRNGVRVLLTKKAFFFGIGCAWIILLFELLGLFVIGLPWSESSLLAIVKFKSMHASGWSLLQRLLAWCQIIFNQQGMPLTAAALFGLGYFVLRCKWPRERKLVVYSAFLGYVYLFFSGSQPMFRQTTVLQPFVFLAVAIFVDAVSRSVSSKRAISALLALVLLLGLDLRPLQQAKSVLVAHRSLGRALRWSQAHSGGRPVYWFQVAWFADSPSWGTPPKKRHASVAKLEEMAGLDDDGLIVSYFPFVLATGDPTANAVLEETQPAFALPSLYATDAMWAELYGRGGEFNPTFQMRTWLSRLMQEIRVYRVRDLKRKLSEKRGERGERGGEASEAEIPRT